MRSARLALAAFLVSALAAGDYFPPPDSQGGWRRPASGDAGQYDPVFRYIQSSTRHGGLLVARDGWLVYERYFGYGHREATPNLASVGKSFTSIAMGILLSERPELFPHGLDTQVFTPRHFPPEAFPLSDRRKRDVKLGQLLSMSAGIRGNNPGVVRGKEVTLDPAGPDGAGAMRDSVAHALTLWCEPGSGYSYATSSIHLISIIIRHVTGVEMEEYIRTKLAGPLGWSRWGFGYKQNQLEHTPGGGGICLRGTDVLRFLYLLLNEGRWNDKQVVPREYVRRCGARSPYNPHTPYSLQFDVNADGTIPGVPRDAYWKSGSGGHGIYIVPSLRLVAFKLGGRDGQYRETDTGLPEPPTTKDLSPAPDWKPEVEHQTAIRETLRLLVQAAKTR